jgi:MscS family membrane protein
MFLAQATTPSTTSLKTSVAQEANLVLGALGWVVGAIVVGWATKRILGWLASKFDESPIVKAAVAAVGKSLQVLIPAYTVFWFNHLNPGLIPDAYDKSANIAIDLLLSVAHTATVYHLVAVPIAWAQKIADETENKLDDVLVPMVGTVIKVTVILVGAVKAVSIVDADTSKSILALLATGGLAVGLASQDTIKNVFGAVMLIIDQPFTLGDLINTGAHEGKVEALGLRSTTLILVDGQRLAIPNSDLANRPIVNITRREFIRAQDLIHLEVNTPAAKVQEAVGIVREIMTNHEGFDPRHPPLVHVHEFADWAVNLRIMYWYYPASAAKQLEFNQRTILAVTERLQKAGIRLAAMGTPQN